MMQIGRKAGNKLRSTVVWFIQIINTEQVPDIPNAMVELIRFEDIAKSGNCSTFS